MTIITKFYRPVNLAKVQACYYSSKLQYRSLKVSNINWTVKKVDLHKLFSPYGPIENIHYPQDPQGRYLGRAIIILEADKGEQAMAALKSYPLEDKDLNIRFLGPARDTPFIQTKESEQEQAKAVEHTE